MPGYKGIPSSDPIEQGLRERWYDSEGSERDAVGAELSAYIWQRTLDAVAEDRKRYPRAKRNAAVGSESMGVGGRYLP